MLVICFRGKCSPLGVITSFAIHKSRRLHGNGCHRPAQLITHCQPEAKLKIWLIKQMKLISILLDASSYNVRLHMFAAKRSWFKTRFCIWSSSRPRKGPREVSPSDQSLPRRPGAEAQSDLLNLSPSWEGEEGGQASSDLWAPDSAKQRSALTNCFGAQHHPPAAPCLPWGGTEIYKLKSSWTFYMTFINRIK